MGLRSVFLIVALPLLAVVAAALLLTPRDILRQPVLPTVEVNPVPDYTSSVSRTPPIAVVQFDEADLEAPKLVVFASQSNPTAVPDPAEEAEAAAPVDRRWITARGLNVRTGPSVRADLIDSLPFGTPVVVLETSGTWAHVRAGDLTGWLSANFLADRDPAAN